mgnify:CR=1 FL=1
MFLAPDFNTRLKAPPPCPGHSSVGGCGSVRTFPSTSSADVLKTETHPFVFFCTCAHILVYVVYCSVPGMAELSNFTGGPFPWLRERLRTMHANGALNMIGETNSSTNVKQIVLVIHQPFRCREGVPDCKFPDETVKLAQFVGSFDKVSDCLGYFCFSTPDKSALRSAFSEDLGENVDKLWGVMAGHQHR